MRLGTEMLSLCVQSLGVVSLPPLHPSAVSSDGHGGESKYVHRLCCAVEVEVIGVERG